MSDENEKHHIPKLKKKLLSLLFPPPYQHTVEVLNPMALIHNEELPLSISKVFVVLHHNLIRGHEYR